MLSTGGCSDAASPAAGERARGGGGGARGGWLEGVGDWGRGGAGARLQVSLPPSRRRPPAPPLARSPPHLHAPCPLPCHPPCRYERVGPQHSWNASQLYTNACTFRLQRHSGGWAGGRAGGRSGCGGWWGGWVGGCATLAGAGACVLLAVQLQPPPRPPPTPLPPPPTRRPPRQRVAALPPLCRPPPPSTDPSTPPPHPPTPQTTTRARRGPTTCCATWPRRLACPWATPPSCCAAPCPRSSFTSWTPWWRVRWRAPPPPPMTTPTTPLLHTWLAVRACML